MGTEGIKLIANNKKAYHDYFVDEVFEAGIELVGTEVKSLRQGHCSIKEAYCGVRNNQCYIYGMHVNPYEHGNIFNKDPLRDRRLLLHKNEIRKIGKELQQAGYALVPLRVYLKKSLVKVEIGLCRGKKNYDKRETLAKKSEKRRLQREFKNTNLRI